jgi:hypothetical protein
MDKYIQAWQMAGNEPNASHSGSNMTFGWNSDMANATQQNLSGLLNSYALGSSNSAPASTPAPSGPAPTPVTTQPAENVMAGLHIPKPAPVDVPVLSGSGVTGGSGVFVPPTFSQAYPGANGGFAKGGDVDPQPDRPKLSPHYYGPPDENLYYYPQGSTFQPNSPLAPAEYPPKPFEEYTPRYQIGSMGLGGRIRKDDGGSIYGQLDDTQFAPEISEQMNNNVYNAMTGSSLSPTGGAALSNVNGVSPGGMSVSPDYQFGFNNLPHDTASPYGALAPIHPPISLSDSELAMGSRSLPTTPSGPPMGVAPAEGGLNTMPDWHILSPTAGRPVVPNTPQTGLASQQPQPPVDVPARVGSAILNAPGAAARGVGNVIGAAVNPLVRALGWTESNNRNIPSQTDRDYPGMPGSKSQGLYQIDTPTWRQYAQPLGVTAPNAMAANGEDQTKVVSTIPFNRFGPRTQRIIAQQFGISPNDFGMTIGQLAQKYTGGDAKSIMAFNGDVQGQPAAFNNVQGGQGLGVNQNAGDVPAEGVAESGGQYSGDYPGDQGGNFLSRLFGGTNQGGHSGLLGLNMSDQTRMGMLAAGLGMMGGTSLNPFTNIGQGGLKGLNTMMEGSKVGAESMRAQAEAIKAMSEAELINSRLRMLMNGAQENANDFDNHAAAINRGDQAGVTATVPEAVGVTAPRPAVVSASQPTPAGRQPTVAPTTQTAGPQVTPAAPQGQAPTLPPMGSDHSAAIPLNQGEHIAQEDDPAWLDQAYHNAQASARRYGWVQNTAGAQNATDSMNKYLEHRNAILNGDASVRIIDQNGNERLFRVTAPQAQQQAIIEQAKEAAHQRAINAAASAHKIEEDLGTQYGEDRKAADAAKITSAGIEAMKQDDLSNFPHGAWADYVQNFNRVAQTVAHGLGVATPGLDQSISGYEQYTKNSGQLVLKMMSDSSSSNRGGFRLAGLIGDKMVANPLMSKLGSQGVMGVMQGMTDYSQAKFLAEDAWLKKNGNLDGFASDWNANVSPTAFVMYRLRQEHPDAYKSLAHDISQTPSGKKDLADIQNQVIWAGEHAGGYLQ